VHPPQNSAVRLCLPSSFFPLLFFSTSHLPSISLDFHFGFPKKSRLVTNWLAQLFQRGHADVEGGRGGAIHCLPNGEGAGRSRERNFAVLLCTIIPRGEVSTFLSAMQLIERRVKRTLSFLLFVSSLNFLRFPIRPIDRCFLFLLFVRSISVSPFIFPASLQKNVRGMPDSSLIGLSIDRLLSLLFSSSLPIDRLFFLSPWLSVFLQSPSDASGGLPVHSPPCTGSSEGRRGGGGRGVNRGRGGPDTGGREVSCRGGVHGGGGGGGSP